MPKAKKAASGHKAKMYSLPSAQKKKDMGVPKLQSSKAVGKQPMPYGKSKSVAAPQTSASTSFSIMAATSAHQHPLDSLAGSSADGSGPGPSTFAPIDASLTTRDSSAKAFMRELRKVIERSDVIIQVLDARDPEGTRSRWVEEEVRKREADGKKLLAVVNKIDLVPRAVLENWLKYLRHSFPCMPFKSSTQSQRGNLSQNAVPLSQPSSVPGQPSVLPALPTTSSSLGAPALLHLLKQYALSTPHSALTVGIVGYPNVGKSSLINSLKRSRACAVAAMPGKTRVVQEVVLDKGVKILDCPGVVLEDFGREMDNEDGRRRQAEIMLRNCIKAELVEDPISPVEVILSKAEPALLQKLYSIPPFDDVRDFLIKIALTRGRLGKGGIPDLEGSAVSVLRDWNSGKIPYFTSPPAVHPSSAPAPLTTGDIDMGAGEQVGDAKILATLSEAFTLDGLLDNMGDEAEWQGGEGEGEDEGVEGGMLEDRDLLDAPPPRTVTSQPPKPDPFAFRSAFPSNVGPASANPSFGFTQQHPLSTLMPRAAPAKTDSKLFTPEELAVLPAGMLDRAKAKQLAKKAKKKRAAAGRTEDELMLGFMGMGVEEPDPEPLSEDERDVVPQRPSKKEKRQMKKVKAKQQAAKSNAPALAASMDVEEDAGMQKEADFAKFLSTMGEADSDEEL
ncbi:hypothetical protein JCM24511_00380 [Saitozyma sp. JCM 24511]|nr:hypothetical protein JCM24511_00380 [Saitozyma sp. JCM 24511]